MMYIKVEFSDDSIFGDYTGEDVDRKASAASFKEHLENKLYDEYPNATIEVIHGDNDDTYVETDAGQDYNEQIRVQFFEAGVWEYYQWEVFVEVG